MDVLDRKLYVHLCCTECKAKWVPSRMLKDIMFCKRYASEKENCPNCLYGKTMRLNFDTMIDSRARSCRYHKYGCQEFQIGSKIRQHEEICKFGLTICNYLGCPDVYHYPEVFAHFKNNHPVCLKFRYNCPFIDCFQKLDDREFGFCIIQDDGNLFKILWKADYESLEIGYLGVNYGHVDSLTKYKFMIKFQDLLRLPGFKADFHCLQPGVLGVTSSKKKISLKFEDDMSLLRFLDDREHFDHLYILYDNKS